MTGPVRERRLDLSGPASQGPGDGVDLRRVSRAVRRQAPLVGLCGLAGLVVAVALILMSVPRYRAVETVLLDEERRELLEAVSPIPNAIYSDSALQSELEILKSRELALQVVDRMNLHEDEAFLDPPAGAAERLAAMADRIVRPVADWLEPEPVVAGPQTPDNVAPVDPEAAARSRAATILQGNMSADRVGRSFVLQIGYEGFSPERARDIARAYGRSYQTYQLEASRDVAANAGAWIQQRLEALEVRSLEAAAELQQFRAENDLVQVRGDLLSEQQLSDMAGELIEASAAVAEVNARLANLEAVEEDTPVEALILAGPTDEAGADDVLQELRREYLDARRRFVALGDQYGPDHPLAQQIGQVLATLEQRIREELQSEIAALRARRDIALGREASLREDLGSLASGSGEDVAMLGRLSQLEAVAETYQEVYRDYLQRYELTTQQQAFPIATVRIISEAEAPRGASSPRKKAGLLSGLLIGLLLGVVIGSLREIGPRRLRTRDEVIELSGLPCAGLLPAGSGARGTDARGRVGRQTALRALAALGRTGQGRVPMVVAIAPVASGSDPMDMAAHLARAMQERGMDQPIVLDCRGSTDRELEKMRRRHGLQVRAAARPSDIGVRTGPDGRRRTILSILPPLTETAGNDPYSERSDATILTIPWGRIRPELVEGALADHPDFGSRLATTVLVGGRLRRARLYMPRGGYEQEAARG
ncbi:GumC family protein [Wenxinia saemankumensis]|uniref:Uncharacterized protein involved in exopolysaccharide biosynthesis n=1 Tax=Wenxinia saemankumensis TaxID=1447782 RepID=A0A1M5ZYB2_9RHOB|nr:GumC family protein [Wenxinia saemankumensis]SHI29265.1 Uncharacterized protein involved in exopolysaccharide biosynthesis [Wenxinia saemankumensis]